MPHPPSRSERLSAATLLAWGGPAMGFAFPLFFVQIYFLKFSADVLLLAPGVIGVLFGLGRIWDAMSDPVAGYLSDRTRTRWGRRRPWMLAAIPLIAAFFSMLWRPPAGLEGTALVAWTAVALFGFYTAFTVYAVPHYSLGAELSLDHHERSRVYGTRHVSFTLGVIVAFAALQAVDTAADPRESAATMVYAAVPVIAAMLLVVPLAVRERPEFQGRGAESPFSAVRDVLGNPHARILLAVIFIESLGGGVLGVLAPFVAQYVLDTDQVALLPAFYVAFSVVSVPLWIRLSRRWGKKRVWLVAMVGTALSFGATMLLGAGDLAEMAFLLACAGTAAGCGGAVGQSLVADVIDADELRTGERKEGSYAATWGLAFKSGGGITVALTGVILQAGGFQPNVEQTPTALWTIKGLFGGAPLVAYLVGAALFRRFGLDEAEHARVRAELDRRAREAEGG